MSDDKATWECILAFDDQSESFVHGFEAGKIYTNMDQNPLMIQQTLHKANTKLFIKMARLKGYEIEIRETICDEWVDVVFRKSSLIQNISIN